VLIDQKQSKHFHTFSQTLKTTLKPKRTYHFKIKALEDLTSHVRNIQTKTLIIWGTSTVSGNFKICITKT